MSKYGEELPKRMGHKKQVWVDNDVYCEPPYFRACKLCFKCRCHNPPKKRSVRSRYRRCGRKKAS